MTEKKTTTNTTITTIKWDDANIRMTYANICNVVSTREEVSMMFGMNQRMDTENNELIIELSDRIILNPYAAKRVSLLLKDVIEQYEEKFSKIELDAVPDTSTVDTTDNVDTTDKKTSSLK